MTRLAAGLTAPSASATGGFSRSSSAKTVAGIDVDPVSVQVSRENAARWMPAGRTASFQHASALDDAAMKALGQFDVVYSWGVLHHTGDMRHALNNAARAVEPGSQSVVRRR